MTKDNETKTTAYVEDGRYRGVENAVRDIMAKNINLRQVAKEELFKSNNPEIFKKDWLVTLISKNITILDTQEPVPTLKNNEPVRVKVLGNPRVSIKADMAVVSHDGSRLIINK